MGDAYSWLILLLGLLAVVMFGVALLVALVAGIILLLKYLFPPNSTNLIKATEPDKSPSTLSTGHATYHVVSDTIGGLNVRKRDNLFQALFIFIAVILLAALGAVLAQLNAKWGMPWFGGALIGAFGGLVFGFFASGTFLMVYRVMRHMQGKHE